MVEAERKLETIGVVEGFFARPSAAVIRMTKGKLKAGERIYIKGHTTTKRSLRRRKAMWSAFRSMTACVRTTWSTG